MDLEEETGWIFSLSDDGLVTLVLVRETDGWTLATPKLVSSGQAKTALVNLSFGCVVLYLLLFTQAASAMERQDSTKSGASQPNVILVQEIPRSRRLSLTREQRFRQRAFRESHSRQSVSNELRRQMLSRRESDLRFCIDIPASSLGLKCWKPKDCISIDREDVKAEAISRGMVDTVILPANCLNIWEVTLPQNVEMSTARLRLLIQYREHTVLPFQKEVETLPSEMEKRVFECLPREIREMDNKVVWHENKVIDTMFSYVEVHSLDSISVAMKSLQDAIVNQRRIDENTTLYRLDQTRQRAQYNYFAKTIELKNLTEKFISESKKAISLASEPMCQ